MKVLVTGGAGYIGSVLNRMLLDRGYKVLCLDRLFFGKETVSDLMGNPDFELLKDDIRWFDPQILEGVDVVMDLASLSNDPSGELNPTKTIDINYLGRTRVARLSKRYGVERYILASTCSVYGFRENTILDEASTTDPLTTYAKANLMAEEDILPLAGRDFTVTVMRQATVYGISPRMRFDLAINGMTLSLFKDKAIKVMRDGTQWRPFIHVKDTSKAFITVMEAPKDQVNSQTFNVGSNDQNYQILPLANAVCKAVGMDPKMQWYGSPDNRSYRVSFDKMRNNLNFNPDFTATDGVRETYEALNNGTLTDSMKTRTVEWYKHLLDAHSIVKETALRDSIL